MNGQERRGVSSQPIERRMRDGEKPRVPGEQVQRNRQDGVDRDQNEDVQEVVHHQLAGRLGKTLPPRASLPQSLQGGDGFLGTEGSIHSDPNRLGLRGSAKNLLEPLHLTLIHDEILSVQRVRLCLGHSLTSQTAAFLRGFPRKP